MSQLHLYNARRIDQVVSYASKDSLVTGKAYHRSILDTRARTRDPGRDVLAVFSSLFGGEMDDLMKA